MQASKGPLRLHSSHLSSCSSSPLPPCCIRHITSVSVVEGARSRTVQFAHTDDSSSRPIDELSIDGHPAKNERASRCACRYEHVASQHIGSPSRHAALRPCRHPRALCAPSRISMRSISRFCRTTRTSALSKDLWSHPPRKPRERPQSSTRDPTIPMHRARPGRIPALQHRPPGQHRLQAQTRPVRANPPLETPSRVDG